MPRGGGVLFCPKAHGHTQHVVARPREQAGRHRGVNAAGHGDYNTPSGHSSYNVILRRNTKRKEVRRGLEPDELARKIIEAASEKQGEDILLLDIRKVASFADYFVIASGQTVRQLQAIIEAVSAAVSKDGVKPLGKEGEPQSGWVLLDYGDVIVHIFAPDERAYYDLEGLWHTATPVVRMQ
ncbi:MAG: ribosome silencing factor [Chloroflexi bacterium]|nr:MAG: ribosome silencing factor [Chloroflexota bacterium]